jgi:hypothetical protein
LLHPIEAVTAAKEKKIPSINQAPTIISNGGGATATVAVPENITAVTIVTATDANPGTTLQYSIVGGADASLFHIDSATGALSFDCGARL